MCTCFHLMMLDLLESGILKILEACILYMLSFWHLFEYVDYREQGKPIYVSRHVTFNVT